MQSSKKIDISKSSLVSLKAELSRKQEEVAKARAKSQADYVHPLPRPKKQTIWTKSNAGVSERGEKDVEEQKEEEDILKKSRTVLEAKSKLYEKLSQDSSALPDDTKFLVDFQQKSSDEQVTTGGTTITDEPEEEEEDTEDLYDESLDPEEDWVDYVDCLGRTRRCLRRDLAYVKEKDFKLFESLGGFKDKDKKSGDVSEQKVTSVEGEPELLSSDMRQELLRQKWEQQEELLRNKTDIHYQDILFDEARSHGVGYYGFSQDETQRRVQQEALSKLRQETKKEQEVTKSLKERRQQQMKARLKAARQRKRARMGLPPEEEEEEEPGEPVQEVEEEEDPLKAQESEKKEEIMKPEPAKRPQPQVRPWDIGKEGVKEVMSQEDWVKKKRTERPEEFAPPSTYQPDYIPTPEEAYEEPGSGLYFTTKKSGNKRSWSEYTSSAKEKEKGTEYYRLIEEEDDDGRGTETTSYPNFDYTGPSTSSRPIRTGAQIPPPPNIDLSGPPSTSKTKASDLESSISAGLKYLREQAEERKSQREKGLLDII